jgi:uncharacterized membrane-anchored protein
MTVDTKAAPTMPGAGAGAVARQVLNRVPEVTIYFWVIKILATTVGETFSDYLSDTQGLGLPLTMAIMGSVLAVVIAFQFKLRRYVPGVYWGVVVLISVVGTNITDQLHDGWGWSNKVIAPMFGICLAATFAWWYASERTLSIHTIHTAKRERFYWLAVLFTFALGTASGDLFAESMNLGYWTSAGIFGAAIAVVYGLHLGFKMNAVLSFWIAYILTRPFGASMGDGMAQKDLDGLGLGTTATSLIYLVVIAAVVVFLSITRVDRETTVMDAAGEHGEFEHHDGQFHAALPHLGHDHPHEPTQQ